MSEQHPAAGEDSISADDSENGGSDADLAAAASEDQEPQTTESVAQAGGKSRRGLGIATLAGLALVIGSGAAIGLFRVGQQVERSNDTTLAMSSAMQAELEVSRAEVGRLEQALDGVRTELESSLTRQAALELDLRALPERITRIQRQVDRLQGGSFDARAVWLRAEAEYYLATANAELRLANRWDTAISALELADDRLRELGDPSLADVRELIAEELLALRSVRLPDVDGMSFSLARLAARADDLPFPRAAAENYRSIPSAADETTGFNRLWAMSKNALTSLIRIERTDEEVDLTLTESERALLRRQFAVELELARTALIRNDQDNFDASLVTARDLLERHFDSSTADVEGAVLLLNELREIRLVPSVPDISASLNALRAAAPGTN